MQALWQRKNSAPGHLSSAVPFQFGRPITSEQRPRAGGFHTDPCRTGLGPVSSISQVWEASLQPRQSELRANGRGLTLALENRPQMRENIRFVLERRPE